MASIEYELYYQLIYIFTTINCKYSMLINEFDGKCILLLAYSQQDDCNLIRDVVDVIVSHMIKLECWMVRLGPAFLSGDYYRISSTLKEGLTNSSINLMAKIVRYTLKKAHLHLFERWKMSTFSHAKYFHLITMRNSDPILYER